MDFWFGFLSIVAFSLYLDAKEGSEKSHMLLAASAVMFLCLVGSLLLQYLDRKKSKSDE
jgi:hypothetical protein